jgi:excisionase family DNA binding protein
MSSNIQIQRICQYCGKEFTARKTTTMCCSDDCSKRAYKARVRAAKVEVSNKETQRIKTQPIEEIKAKEFLTVRNVATLLNCSIRSVYYYIENGNIKAVNLGQRITRIKRSELDKLFEQTVTPQPESRAELMQYNILDCYNLTEIQSKYRISEKALYDIIKRNKIPKVEEGGFAYVPRILIDKLLS